MQTITIDILNNNAMGLLQNLENLQLIRLHHEDVEKKQSLSQKYKGIISTEDAKNLNNHINQIREEWKNT